MKRVFNTTGMCVPEAHYMVNIDSRLKEIEKLVDAGSYFTINRARQYGKTTTLLALSRVLQEKYDIVFMDFQTFGSEEFKNENRFSLSFAKLFLKLYLRNQLSKSDNLQEVLNELKKAVSENTEQFTLFSLFEILNDICAASDKGIVLMIDEVDSASNNQVFIDFLAQIRAQYLRRFQQPAFQSVILASVYDIKNLKQKIRMDEDHKYNSPWNIAADFDVDMSFSKKDIAGMLEEYEKDHLTGMDVEEVSGLIYDYTSGYPFLVSRICQLIDQKISMQLESEKEAWTRNGFHAALRLLLTEKNTLFDSLMGKLHDYPKLARMIKELLFTGRTYCYATDESAIDMASMFGFIKNQNGNVAIANRIFETRLYNYFLSEDEMQEKEIYKASLQEKNQFISNGFLNMRLVLEKFVLHFQEIYGSCNDKFIEEQGRQLFLLYLRPIINGTGNYYVEARTRDLRRADIVVDYHGKRYVIEMKIWHGKEYNNRGEQQLVGYLNDYHLNTGYMLSFNFNKNKQVGVHEIYVGDKKIIEAIV